MLLTYCSLDYLSLQQLRYHVPNSVYPNRPDPNPSCQLSLWEGPEHPEKTHDFRQSVDRLFSHELLDR
jgi:hypothetical protein